MSSGHIGLLCTGWWPDAGGVESHTRDLAQELLARGRRVSVLCLEGTRQRMSYETQDSEVDGVHVRRMSYAYEDHRALADLVASPRAESVVRSWLADRAVDLVHVHHLTGFGAGALTAIELASVPVMMTLHDYWLLCPRGQMLHTNGTVCEKPEPDTCAKCIGATWTHLLPSGTGRSRGPGEEALTSDAQAADLRTRYALQQLASARRLIAPSAAAASVFAAAGVARKRIEVCPNGIDAAGLCAEVNSARLPRIGGLRLGVLGTVQPSKGVLELARAFIRAVAGNMTLEIHGALPSYHGDGSYVDALMELTVAEPRIRVHGAYTRDKLPSVLAGLDLVAAPSRWEEVFGLGVREARAVGLPVLVSNRGGLPELVTDGGGMVIDSEREGAWTAAIEAFAADSTRFGQAPAVVRSTREMVDQLELAYDEVTAGGVNTAAYDGG